MQPELRLVRYFVAVAEERNITRAAERLHISQPALSAAVRQLEQLLGVELLDRSDRVLAVTPAGELLLAEGRGLLAEADRVFEAVRGRDAAVVGRLRIGLTPTARYGLGPALLAACASAASGVMLYPQEDTTGALLRDVRSGRLDLAVLFCAVDGEPWIEEPAVVHLRSDHPLAARSSVALEELAGETFLVAESADSGGFTARVVELCSARGFTPLTGAIQSYVTESQSGSTRDEALCTVAHRQKTAVLDRPRQPRDGCGPHRVPKRASQYSQRRVAAPHSLSFQRE